MRFGWVVLALIIALTLAAYSRSFSSEFQFDDHQIVDNPSVRKGDFVAFLPWARTRLIPNATLFLNFQLGADDPFDYHLVNFVVHAVATCFVFLLALELCRTPRLREGSVAARPLVFAATAAVLFACHPIQVQAVTYIAQRVASMAAMFYIGSVLLYVRARNAGEEGETSEQRWCFVGAGLLAILAFLSKESTLSLPLAILLVEMVLFGPSWRGVGRALVPFSILGLVIPLGWALLPSSLHDMGLADVRELLSLRDSALGPAIEYGLTQYLVIPRYFGLVLWPVGFNIDHDVAPANEMSAPVLAGALLLFTVLLFGIYAARRWPAAGFGALWVLVALSVESSFLPLRDFMNEHRMYLVMPGVGLAVASLFVRASIWLPRVAPAVGLVAVVALSWLTSDRNEDWQTQRSLWGDALTKSPNKARVHLNYGTALHLDGEIGDALFHYCRALEIDPENGRALSNFNIIQRDRLISGEAEIEVVVQDDGTVIGVPSDPCPDLLRAKEEAKQALPLRLLEPIVLPS